MFNYLDQRNRDPKPLSNRDPKPLRWTADADLILGKSKRLWKRISNSGHLPEITDPGTRLFRGAGCQR
jgi:hypothetical protein